MYCLSFPNLFVFRGNVLIHEAQYKLNCPLLPHTLPQFSTCGDDVSIVQSCIPQWGWALGLESPRWDQYKGCARAKILVRYSVHMGVRGIAQRSNMLKNELKDCIPVSSFIMISLNNFSCPNISYLLHSSGLCKISVRFQHFQMFSINPPTYMTGLELLEPDPGDVNQPR